MYNVRLHRIFSILLPLLLITSTLFTPPAEASETHAYQSNPGTEINRTLAEISRAERAEDWHLMYDLMLPEARMEISRTAFVNWWPTYGPAAPADVLQVENLEFADITYELTETDFGNVAFATYSYHDINGSDVERTTQLAEIGGMWRWMPQITQDDLPDINAHGGFTVNFSSDYTTEVYQELDTFWAQIFSDWGIAYHSPADMVGVRVEGTPTGCGPLEDVESIFAHYCTLDETIYFNPDMRDLIVDNLGQPAWDMVMAHEWAHHIQHISGMYVTKSPELFGGHYSIEHELMADCLSATFMQGATVRDIYDMRSIREMDQMFELSGDAAGTSWDDITAHGTSDQRRAAFQTGFDDGLRGCNLQPN